jgi:hypothetical protein
MNQMEKHERFVRRIAHDHVFLRVNVVKDTSAAGRRIAYLQSAGHAELFHYYTQNA